MHAAFNKDLTLEYKDTVFEEIVVTWGYSSEINSAPLR